jgi:hypothetical protein
MNTLHASNHPLSESSASYTPHPWEVRPIGIGTQTPHSGYAITQAGASESTGWIATIPRSETNPTRANARLIASAPLLLETIKYALQNAMQDREEFLRTHTNHSGTMDDDAAFLFAELEADIELYTSAINGAVGNI